jgi:PAS domain S-box-containing protein
MSIASILVVEDEAIVAANIEMRLQSLGYNVPAVVDTGREALEVIAEARPDLVLMDIRIAGPIDGITTAEIIRTTHAIPVIYLTAYTDEEMLQRARQTEPYGYILKPFEIGELRTAVELALYRHAAERQRRAHEQWRATVLQSIGDAMITTDTAQHITYMNPSAETLTGWSLQEAIDRPIDQVVQLIDELSYARIERVIAQPTESIRQLLLVGRTQTTPVESLVTPLVGEASAIGGAILVLRDLRERRAFETRLRLIEAAVQQTDQLVAIFESANPAPQLVFVNQSFSRALGYRSEELLGQPFEILYGQATGATLIEQTERAFAGLEPAHGEGILYRKGGSSFYAEWNVTPMRGIHGTATHWIAVLRDVTRRRREQEVRAQRQKLESLGILAGGIAHDFNNLLAVVLGNASMVMFELPPDSPVRDLVRPIESAARRAADLTRQMLSYAGHDRITAQSLDLNDLVSQACASLAGTIPSIISLTTNLRLGLPFAIADTEQILRVIKNLVINAYESIDDKPGTIILTTELRTVDRAYIASTYLAPSLPEGSYLTLVVSDTGVGMPPEVAQRMFEPFFTTKFTGRGLGLAETFGIVSAHHGMIKVESVVGQGTTCTVLLPIISGGDLDQFEALVPGLTAAIGGDHAVLMVIEPPTLDIVSRMLERAGYGVLRATDEAQAQTFFRAYTRVINGVVIVATPDECSWRAEQIHQIRAETPVFQLGEGGLDTDTLLAVVAEQIG